MLEKVGNNFLAVSRNNESYLVQLQYIHCILDNYKFRLMSNKIDYEIDQNKIK